MMLKPALRPPLRAPMRGATTLREGGGVYAFVNAEAEALVARFTTPPTDARKALIDTFAGSLKTAGVWSKLDALYLMAAADAQAAQRNWIADAYNLTPTNSPAFTADRGYAGDGASSYLGSGFGPSTAPSPKFTQNSASFGVWSRTAGVNGQQVAGQSANVILPTTGVNATIRVNNGGTASSAANTASDGFFLANRSGAAAETLRRNKVGIVSATPASVAVDAAAFTFGRRTSTFSTLQMALGFIGGSLTTGESDAFYDAALVYLQAVGAA